MAIVVGTGLLICSFAGLPLQYAAGGVWVKVVPAAWTVHGFLYMVYLLTAVDLARRARFTLPQIAATIGAGFLPFLAFFVEHRVTVRVRGMAGAGAGAVPGADHPLGSDDAAGAGGPPDVAAPAPLDS
jgi:integral membrane protein